MEDAPTPPIVPGHDTSGWLGLCNILLFHKTPNYTLKYFDDKLQQNPGIYLSLLRYCISFLIHLKIKNAISSVKFFKWMNHFINHYKTRTNQKTICHEEIVGYAYICLDCSQGECKVICTKCFTHGSHLHHNYRLIKCTQAICTCDEIDDSPPLENIIANPSNYNCCCPKLSMIFEEINDRLCSLLHLNHLESFQSILLITLELLKVHRNSNLVDYMHRALNKQLLDCQYRDDISRFQFILRRCFLPQRKPSEICNSVYQLISILKLSTQYYAQTVLVAFFNEYREIYNCHENLRFIRNIKICQLEPLDLAQTLPLIQQNALSITISTLRDLYSSISYLDNVPNKTSDEINLNIPKYVFHQNSSNLEYYSSKSHYLIKLNSFDGPYLDPLKSYLQLPFKKLTINHEHLLLNPCILSDIQILVYNKHLCRDFIFSPKDILLMTSTLYLLQSMNPFYRQVDNHIEFENMKFFECFKNEVQWLKFWKRLLNCGLYTNQEIGNTLNQENVKKIGSLVYCFANTLLYDHTMFQTLNTSVSIHIPLHRIFSMICLCLVQKYNPSSFHDAILQFLPNGPIPSSELSAIYSSKMNFWLTFLLSPLRIQAFFAEIIAKKWIRNGERFCTQVEAFYRSSSDILQLDLFSIQMAASHIISELNHDQSSMTGQDYFFNLVVQQFGLANHFLQDSSNISIIEEFLRLIYSIICDRSPVSNTTAILRSRIIHVLCSSSRPLTYTHLVSRLQLGSSTNAMVSSCLKDLEILLEELCVFHKATEHKDGTFSLKDRHWREFMGQPSLYFNYRQREMNLAEENLIKIQQKIRSSFRGTSYYVQEEEEKNNSNCLFSSPSFLMGDNLLLLLHSKYLYHFLQQLFDFIREENNIQSIDKSSSLNRMFSSALHLVALILSFPPNGKNNNKIPKGFIRQHTSNIHISPLVHFRLSRFNNQTSEPDVFDDLESVASEPFFCVDGEGAVLGLILDSIESILLSNVDHLVEKNEKEIKNVLLLGYVRLGKPLHSDIFHQSSSPVTNYISSQRIMFKRQVSQRKSRILKEFVEMQQRFVSQNQQQPVMSNKVKEQEEEHRCCLCHELANNSEFGMISFYNSIDPFFLNYNKSMTNEKRDVQFDASLVKSCGHTMHLNCLKEYVKTNNLSNQSTFFCPTCRGISNILIMIQKKQDTQDETKTNEMVIKDRNNWLDDNNLEKVLEKNQEQDIWKSSLPFIFYFSNGQISNHHYYIHSIISDTFSIWEHSLRDDCCPNDCDIINVFYSQISNFISRDREFKSSMAQLISIEPFNGHHHWSHKLLSKDIFKIFIRNSCMFLKANLSDILEVSYLFYLAQICQSVVYISSQKQHTKKITSISKVDSISSLLWFHMAVNLGEIDLSFTYQQHLDSQEEKKEEQDGGQDQKEDEEENQKYFNLMNRINISFLRKMTLYLSLLFSIRNIPFNHRDFNNMFPLVTKQSNFSFITKPIIREKVYNWFREYFERNQVVQRPIVVDNGLCFSFKGLLPFYHDYFQGDQSCDWDHNIENDNRKHDSNMVICLLCGSRTCSACYTDACHLHKCDQYVGIFFNIKDRCVSIRWNNKIYPIQYQLYLNKFGDSACPDPLESPFMLNQMRVKYLTNMYLKQDISNYIFSMFGQIL
jgi:hypothetical protein